MKVLVFDIETAPIAASVWGLFDQNVSLNQIKADWHLLSWAAKWLGDPPSKVMYRDQRHAKNIEDDKAILIGLWELLNEADVVVGQNIKSFDSKKVNARFVMHGMKPPSPYQQIDTLRLARKHFAFTSNKLEYLSSKLCKSKKLKPKKFQGFELWAACMAGNVAAWNEMKAYNCMDVIATEELYHKLSPWGAPVDLNPMRKSHEFICNCGSNKTQAKGFNYNKTGKYQRYCCTECGSWSTAKENLLDKHKRKALRK